MTEIAEEIKTGHEYYILRTASGKEDKFLDAIENVLPQKKDHGIYSVFKPESVKGYLFIEAESLTKVVDSLRGIPNNKGVIRTPVRMDELQKYFEKDGEQIIVNERDIVEIVAGPFKGDRAKVVRIVPGKDEVIIEPINMAVPIPITLSLDDIRVIDISNELENENE